MSIIRQNNSLSLTYCFLGVAENQLTSQQEEQGGMVRFLVS